VYRRILIALDGSEPAEAVLAPAEELAEKLGATLVLVRVAPRRTASSVAGGPVREAAETYLEGVAQRLSQRGRSVESMLRVGEPAQEIVAAARSSEVDLIAMTTHGRSGLGRLRFGSVAEAVLREALTPVLLVRIQPT
jgi:nucleotide-binding universal stress UspA family protein